MNLQGNACIFEDLQYFVVVHALFIPLFVLKTHIQPHIWNADGQLSVQVEELVTDFLIYSVVLWMRLDIWVFLYYFSLFVRSNRFISAVVGVGDGFNLLFELVFLQSGLFLNFDQPFFELLLGECLLQVEPEKHADEHFLGLLEGVGVKFDQLRTGDFLLLVFRVGLFLLVLGDGVDHLVDGLVALFLYIIKHE